MTSKNTMPPNGQTGLRSDKSWALDEIKGLREALAAERERTRIAREEFKRLEDKLNGLAEAGP